MHKEGKRKDESLEDYWLPKFEEAALLDDVASRNLSFSYGHVERRRVFMDMVGEYMPATAKSVLDVGCGSGTYFDLYEQLGLEVMGIDFSKSQIEAARARFPNSKLQACFVQDAPESIQADLIVSIGVTQAISDIDSFLAEIAKRLSPDGIAVVSCLNKRSIWPGGITDPLLIFYRLEEMRAAMAEHFTEIGFKRFYPLPILSKVLRPALYRSQVPLLNHGFMFVLKKK